ncbi:hypothetical protein FDECE_11675 [Fusarium decemcellulare]|nr:hypothetical protein FDECE_11675 [Fusarium decemcellulare]
MTQTFSLPIRSHPRYLLAEEEDATPKPLPSDPASLEWRVPKQDTFLQNGTLMPLHPREHIREDAQIQEAPDPRSSRKVSPLPTADFLADQISLLRLVNDNLKLARSSSSSTDPQTERVRSASSSYPNEEQELDRIQSPVSEADASKLNLGDLTQYSRTNDRLSNLRSSSSSGGARAVSARSTKRSITDAVATITEWQRQPITSYHRFELSLSSEELPTSGTTLRNSNDSGGSQPSSDRTVITHESSRVHLINVKNQLDGVGETHHPGSPNSSVQLPRRATKVIKRRASGVSLRSLTNGVKRTRLEVKRLASTAYYSSSRKLGRARDNIKRRHDKDKKQYSAWKAMRRRLRPGDAIKGKSEKGFATFSFERNRHGHETWWKRGVKKYQAPSWMRFGN